MASVDAIAFGSLIALGEYVLTQRASAKDDTAAAAAAESAASGASQPKQSGSILKLFRIPGLSKAGEIELIAKFNSKLEEIGSLSRVSKVSTESSLYIQFEDGASFESIGADGQNRLKWLLSDPSRPSDLAGSSFLQAPSEADKAGGRSFTMEVGPRLAFTSAFSTNACSICRRCGLLVRRLERYRRYLVEMEPAPDAAAAAGGGKGSSGSSPPSVEQEEVVLAGLVHDRMTEMRLRAPLETFESGAAPEPWNTVPLLAEGAAALRAVNKSMGLGMDDQDIDLYTDLFVKDLKRDPTTVELFDISQSNSEHSRHWFFKGRMVIDGEDTGRNLMQVVGSTLDGRKHNSVVAFEDNSSAIKGFTSPFLVPSQPGYSSPMAVVPRTRHLLLTAETHNFPSGVAPFPGAETGTGGRIRDTHATGRGSLVAVGVAAYCVGALKLPGYEMEWEQEGGVGEWEYPEGLATPAQIITDASNGASDYGNKFGEPVVSGFARSFGLRLPAAKGASPGERREWVKPIMFSAGIGLLDEAHALKDAPEEGMVITKIGGPAYRIGMGGSAASSMMQGDNDAALDFNAVQRGDAEMAQKVNRVIRACVELGERNPIVSIHDQGAGGNCNVLKEICEPMGGRIDIRKVRLGDHTMSVLEIWGAEYQESDALLLRRESLDLFKELCERECVECEFVGEVKDQPDVVVEDSRDGSTPVRIDVGKVLGGLKPKTYELKRAPAPSSPLTLPADLTARAALDRVLRLMSVGSKRFLTNKVDRSVTGLVAQQQCVGPLHTPLADCSVTASSYLDTVGTASSVGEQGIRSLLDPAAMARGAVGEAVTNLMAARISGLEDVKCSANWMWAAKLPGEGAALWDAAVAMSDAMKAVGLSVDGGKDSLSMAARCPGDEMVKAPGQLVITTYAPCPDIRVVATPDLKAPGASVLVHVPLSGRRGGGLAAPARLGASSLAHVFGQVGDCPPDLDDADVLRRGFDAVQGLLDASGSKVLSLHDVSDGGLLVAVLEMAFAGNCGVQLQLRGKDAEPGLKAGTGAEGAAAAAAGGAEEEEAKEDAAGDDEEDEEQGEEEEEDSAPNDADVLLPSGWSGDSEEAVGSLLRSLFAEELGVVLEVPAGKEDEVVGAIRGVGVPAAVIGQTTAGTKVSVAVAPEAGDEASAALVVLEDDVRDLRDRWEETSFQLERRQTDLACVEQEQEGLRERHAPKWALGFEPADTPAPLLSLPAHRKHAVAIVRAEGSNGDREMAGAFYAAGFAPWDVSMSDLEEGRASLDRFRGVAFVGGFSFADVLDSAKGWAGSILFSAEVRGQFERFLAREDTFSLGVCNGCQLMGLLGMVPFPKEAAEGEGKGEGEEEGQGDGFGLPASKQPRFVHNASRRFESRFSSIAVGKSPSVMLRGMEGSVLGVHVDHGEGRAFFPDEAVLEAVEKSGLAPLRYVDDDGAPTERYPLNPNGSPQGIAGLCSPCGRHLAMMPHPERCFLTWQWPWMPAEWKKELKASPWLRMFQNARQWCDETRFQKSL